MTLPPPQVVNIRRCAPGVEAGYDQYIGLGTPWGNPFANTCSRTSAIRQYEKRIRGFLKDAGWRVDLKALSGKKLGCHCAPLPCHGDVLVKLFLELWGPNGKLVSGDLCAGSHNPEAGS